jgi:hypothetical protein
LTSPVDALEGDGFLGSSGSLGKTAVALGDGSRCGVKDSRVEKMTSVCGAGTAAPTFAALLAVVMAGRSNRYVTSGTFISLALREREESSAFIFGLFVAFAWARVASRAGTGFFVRFAAAVFLA